MFSVSGFVVVRETNSGLAGLRVVLYDLDPSQYKEQSKASSKSKEPRAFEDLILGQRIGSVLTGTDGSFRFQFDIDLFLSKDTEKRPDLLLYVLAPEDTEPNSRLPKTVIQRVLHWSIEPVPNAGINEELLIRLPTHLIEALQLANSYPMQSTQISLMAASQRAAMTKLWRKNETARLLKEGLEAKTKTDAAFINFSLSSFPTAFRQSAFYLNAGENSSEKSKAGSSRNN